MIRTSEQGYVSLLAVFAVSAVLLFFMQQIMDIRKSTNFLHSLQKNASENDRVFLMLAQKLDYARIMGNFSPGCPNVGGARFKQVNLNPRTTLCVPQTGLCISMTLADNTSQTYCASSNAGVLSLPPSGTQSNVIESASSGGAITNQITIPSTGRLVQRCNSASSPCIRIALCPQGSINCPLAEALQTKVVLFR